MAVISIIPLMCPVSDASGRHVHTSAPVRNGLGSLEAGTILRWWVWVCSEISRIFDIHEWQEQLRSMFLLQCLPAHYLSAQMLELFSSGLLQLSHLSVLVLFVKDGHVMSTRLPVWWSWGSAEAWKENSWSLSIWYVCTLLESGHETHNSLKIHPSNDLLDNTRTLELMPLQREISVFRWRLVSLLLQPARLL